MKKLNISEASVIVGGTSKTCTVTYVTTDSGCKEVTTCTDKHGKIVSQDSKNTALTNCK